ncbi:hypothetical protein [Ideonella sp.]|jgi:hypothetical protein|uniref:hypothetical protein n=1 Tax=Ideonella sp. TaxID=1929293 RepID=UPI0037C18DAA
MNCLAKSDACVEPVPRAANAGAVLAREAGLPFEPQRDQTESSEPFSEWLSLMEVVHMLCPTCPVREQAMQGTNWRL